MKWRDLNHEECTVITTDDCFGGHADGFVEAHLQRGTLLCALCASLYLKWKLVPDHQKNKRNLDGLRYERMITHAEIDHTGHGRLNVLAVGRFNGRVEAINSLLL